VDGVAAVDSLHPQGDILAILPAAIHLEFHPIFDAVKLLSFK